MLLGLSLAGLGVYILLAPAGSWGAGLTATYWPLFLALAGVVRVIGYLIDRRPRSPVGGLLLTALGAIIFSANLLGHHSILVALSKYWFWFLLAFIAGRLMKQYLYRSSDGGRAPRAFAPAAVIAMILIAATGLAADYAVKHGRESLFQLRGLSGLERFGKVGEYLFQDVITVDDPIQNFDLVSGARLSIEKFKGSIEISNSLLPQATARISKAVRAANQEEAVGKVKTVALKVLPEGRDYRFTLDSIQTDEDLKVKLLISLPQQIAANLEIDSPAGSVKISDLTGDHLIRNADQIEIARNAGTVRIESPRGDVSLEQIKNSVTITKARGRVSLQDIAGPVQLDLSGDELTAENLNGPLTMRAADAKIRLQNIGLHAETSRSAVQLTDLQNCRIELDDVVGRVEIKGQRNRIEANRIKGEFVISNTEERIHARRVEGSLRINAENGAVAVEEMLGSARIDATRDVKVDDFTGPLVVHTTNGSIRLATEKKIQEELSAQCDRGRISVSLPSNSPFRLEAGAAGGRVRFSGFGEFISQRTEKSSIQGYNLNEASPLVSLRAGAGNIQFRSSGEIDQDAEEKQARN